jgi:hypothetical protein
MLQSNHVLGRDVRLAEIIGKFVQLLNELALGMREALTFFTDMIAVTPASKGFVGALAIADSAVMAHREFVSFRGTG